MIASQDSRLDEILTLLRGQLQSPSTPTTTSTSYASAPIPQATPSRSMVEQPTTSCDFLTGLNPPSEHPLGVVAPLRYSSLIGVEHPVKYVALFGMFS
ncbi:hypothetical protein Scep_022452 [Stephania cephalantha]|uniref:Uncharacterized protein n=1 Tax=Stephania cephalantha TaxID=152367 RepID=A0AAP0FF68_9MAGN